MNVGVVPKEVLKDLALEFQEAHDGDTFKRILIRVDKLIVWTTQREVRKWQHLNGENRQDLYQTALIGLCDALERIRETDTPDQSIFKMVAYIRAALRKTYPAIPYKYLSTESPTMNEPVYRALESECLQQVYRSLVAEGVITQQELTLLWDRYVYDMPWKTIAATSRLNISCAKQIVYAARNRMRHQLRMRGITGED